MYRHLLVTVDGAPGGIDAIGHALELARAVGARVTFVLPGAAPDSRLSGARLPEHGAKVEAAARAQGLSYVIAGPAVRGRRHSPRRTGGRTRLRPDRRCGTAARCRRGGLR
ncbi:universal stress protein [Burkholderia contaminans]|uniref:universal stress protein n=1 Tax=Burkholderia contaminans TaxID=488447 RepID=UPI0024164A9E|nr:universal stress protein [Burkholderia contaminans]WFN11043.1 universal stress protein [Burkholderia contaminans]